MIDTWDFREELRLEPPDDHLIQLISFGNRKKRTATLNYIEEDFPDDGVDYSKEDFEFNMGRIEGLNKLGSQADPTFVRVTPTQDAQFRTRVPWTTDSGVRKSLLSEWHYWKHGSGSEAHQQQGENSPHASLRR